MKDSHIFSKLLNTEAVWGYEDDSRCDEIASSLGDISSSPVIEGIYSK